MAIFRSKPRLNPLGKWPFFDFLQFLFLKPRKAILRSRISKKTFSWPISPNKKTWKNRHFLTQTMGYPLWKNGHFRLFELLVFKA